MASKKKRTPSQDREFFVVDVNKPVSATKKVAGSRFDDFNQVLLNQVVFALNPHNHGPDFENQMRQAAVQAMVGIAPRNEIEGMLAAQMVACHNATMACYRRAASQEQTLDQASFNLRFASKLSRVFTMQIEALQRFRGQSSQQKVEVTHLHVHEGGQAIVAGNIERPALKGAGDDEKREKQPHAKQEQAKQIGHAPSAALPCVDTQQDRMPIPRDA